MGKAKQVLGSVLFFVLGSLVLTLLFNPELLSPPHSDLRLLETQTFDLINKERSDRGLPILRNNSILVIMAQEWSEYMLSRGILEHGDFEGRMRRVGYLGKYECGEIIQMIQGYRSDIEGRLLQGWLESVGHREIMLTPKEGEMGVGIASKGDIYYATVDFIFYD